MIEYPMLLVFPVAMAFAAAFDLLTMTIPNKISVGFSFAVLATKSDEEYGSDDEIKRHSPVKANFHLIIPQQQQATNFQHRLGDLKRMNFQSLIKMDLSSML